MLGAGPCQVNAIRRMEEEMGIEVVAADYYPDAPGKAFSTYQSEASTFDVKACLEAARRYEVDGVMTTGTDQPVHTAAAVSEALGLRFFFDSQKALDVTDKRRMKTILDRAGIPNVAHAFIGKDFKDSDIGHLDPPYVIKPLDSQGQRGVFRLDSAEAVRTHFDKTLSYSRKTEVLLESYYPNEEITVSGWVVDGDPVILTVTDRLVMETNMHIGICVAHQFPSRHMNARRREIEDLTLQVTKAFDLRQGPIYYQMLVGSEGVKINEIACRIGGAYEDQFIPFLSGVDPLKLQADFILNRFAPGKELPGHDAWSVSGHMSAQLFFASAGTIASQTPVEEVSEIPGVFGAGYHFHEGDRLPAIENATQRAGYFLVAAPDRQTLKERVAFVYESLKWKDDKGNDMVMPGPVLEKEGK